MLFHHVYGVPYIHGESVKGLVRYTFIEKYFGNNPDRLNKDTVGKLEREEYGEDRNLQEKYALIFGTQKREGFIVFFDAYPTFLKEDNIVIDIPHYKEYYSTKGSKPPADWDNPNPIFFLTIEDVSFRFTIGCDPLRAKAMGINDNKLLDEVISYLKEGLATFGLGAKKRKGYGWFEIPDS